VWVGAGIGTAAGIGLGAAYYATRPRYFYPAPYPAYPAHPAYPAYPATPYPYPTYYYPPAWPVPKMHYGF
jgi:hypothetical protein